MGRNNIDSDGDDSDESSKSFSDDSEEYSSNEEEELKIESSSDENSDPDITSIIDSVCHDLSMKESIITTSNDANIKTESGDENTKTITKKAEPSESNLKRGRYLRACPEIDLLNQKPLTKTKNRKIIKNYNLLKPRSFGKIKVYVTTSSFIDSIIEVLVASYFTVQKFQDSINEYTETLTTNKTDFLNLLKEYLQTFNATKLYAARMKLIIAVCEFDNDKFTWCYV